MKAAYYLRAQNFEAPSINQTNIQSIPRSDEGKLGIPKNIMFDNRVCRGNTYSNPVITEDERRNQRVFETEQSIKFRHRELLRKKRTKIRDGTPPPVRGRVHISIQTDGTLDEIFAEHENSVMMTDEAGNKIVEVEGSCHTSIESKNIDIKDTDGVSSMEDQNQSSESNVVEVNDDSKGDSDCNGRSGISENTETRDNDAVLSSEDQNHFTQSNTVEAKDNSKCGSDSNKGENGTSKHPIYDGENEFAQNLSKFVLEEAKRAAIDNLSKVDYRSDPE